LRPGGKPRRAFCLLRVVALCAPEPVAALPNPKQWSLDMPYGIFGDYFDSQSNPLVPGSYRPSAGAVISA
jgi:hypothetical protein